jgi:hypothetical protein
MSHVSFPQLHAATVGTERLVDRATRMLDYNDLPETVTQLSRSVDQDTAFLVACAAQILRSDR